MRKERKRTKVHLTTVGCPKNLVDSESLLAQINANNFEIVDVPHCADVAIVNTCGFIGAAKEESIDTILQFAELKKAGSLKQLLVMGCLAQRYRDELIKEIPEIDEVFGVQQQPAVIKSLGGEYRYELPGERMLTTPKHTAYLKIAEGCDNPCSFCAIPLIRGKYVSRPMEELIREGKSLAAHGVKELIVIAQDTTYYGLDLYGRRRLADLLFALAEIDGVEWIRLMYTYPTKFPRDVLKALREIPKLCRYIDLPVQHSSDVVLRSMRRGISARALRDLIHEIRDSVPDIALRTTLIVGYPEETEREFEDLVKFVEEMRFERLGAFTYSQEEGTAAFLLGDPVPEMEKERRRDTILEIQREISAERNAERIGTVVRVLIDRVEDVSLPRGEMARYLVGRTEWDAPEIDNEVLLSFRSNEDTIPVGACPEIAEGRFVEAKITSATEHDLFGEIL
jgi:ribosomal protein S12 methylthiotransferase